MLRTSARAARASGIPPMLWGAFVLLVIACWPASAQRDTTRRDTTTKRTPSDSARVADSIAVVRDLERLRAEPRSRDPGQQPVQGAQSNPRMLPDISAVGDLVGDLSPKGSTQEGGERFSVREVEVAMQAAVDPYFRGDVFLGISDLEKISIEQAYLTATSLPWGLEVRLGRYLMPVGKQNTTHRHDLQTVDYPYVLQRFLAPEGLKGTGIHASKIFAPFGFYQELILTAVDRFGEPTEGLVTIEPVNKTLSGLGYSAQTSQLLGSESGEQHRAVVFRHHRQARAAGVRRRRPRSARQRDRASSERTSRIAGARSSRVSTSRSSCRRSSSSNSTRKTRHSSCPVGYLRMVWSMAGPTRNFTGGYAFARYQLTRRGYLGARFDSFQDEGAGGSATNAVSGYLEFFPSEFSKLMVGYERYSPAEGSATNRILLQATFALGPHKPHPF